MLFPVKKAQPSNGTQASGANSNIGDKSQLAKTRLAKDFGTLDLPNNCAMKIIKTNTGQDDLQNFTVILTPTEESYWHGAVYPFAFTVPDNFPMEPPKVHCGETIYHPNIDLDGNVCLNILRKDWSAVLTINHIIYGLETLFADPNPEDPLNRDAATLQTHNLSGFIQEVKATLKGGMKHGKVFKKFRY
jgi:ubiquitin-conjugating enzyme E2 M